MSLRRHWLPFAPLMPYKPLPEYEMGKHGGHQFGGINTIDKTLARAWHRAESTGRITTGMADEICVNLLNKHPAEVFGEAWWEV